METKDTVTTPSPTPPTNYCVECGGILSYDSAMKFYTCKSCGLTFNSQQLMEARMKIRERETPDEQKRRRQNDYLKWWLSKKA